MNHLSSSPNANSAILYRRRLVPLLTILVAIALLFAIGLRSTPSVEAADPPTVAEVSDEKETSGALNWRVMPAQNAAGGSTQFVVAYASSQFLAGGFTCSTAEAVTIPNCDGTLTTLAVDPTSTGADTDPPGSCWWGGDGTDNDLWFSWTNNTGAEQFLNATTDSAVYPGNVGADTQLAIYDSCGGTELACDEDTGGVLTSDASTAVADGATVYIQLDGFEGDTLYAELGLSCASAPTAPTNDDCGTPTVIPGGATTFSDAINTEFATTAASDPNTSCGSTANTQQSNSVWYAFTPTANGAITVTTDGSNYDTVMEIWDASAGCGALATVSHPAGASGNACDDDGGSGTQSTLESVQVTAGAPYLIEVMGFSMSGGGSLDFNFEFAQPVGIVCNLDAPIEVATASELNNAIACFNTTTIVDTHSISFTSDIAAGAGTTVITNTLPGVALHIAGNGFALDGENSARGLRINGDTHVSIDSLIVRNGAADLGAGIYNEGTLTMSHSTLLNNTASNSGGAMMVNGGTATVMHSTLLGNTATNKGGGFRIVGSGEVHLHNSTLSGNMATSGGGLQVEGRGRATIANSTFFGNTGSGIYKEAGWITIINSILAGNTGGDCNPIPGRLGNVNSTYTLIKDGSCDAAAGNARNNLNGDPQLDALGDNGGSTHTHMLLPGSPAIDAGDNATCEMNDQRGESRSSDHRCDMGAFELQFDDSPTVIEDALVEGVERTFGPTLVKLTQTAGATDPGEVSITKVTSFPAHTFVDGEMALLWRIHADVESGLNIDAEFCYTDADLATLQGSHTESDLLIWRQPVSGDAWLPVGGQTADPANNCIAVSGISDFSNWALATNTPTAVELDYFDAIANADNTVTLDWATASEVDHAGFNIYRRAANSRDDWAIVNSQLVASRGSMAQGAEYSLADATVEAGNWEYLLEDVETDGDTFRHADAIATVTVSTPTAVALSTAGAQRSGVAWLALALAATLAVTGVLLRKRSQESMIISQRPLKTGGPAETQRSEAATAYQKPAMQRYTATQIRMAIGPAVGFSVDSSLDDELLGLDG